MSISPVDAPLFSVGATPPLPERVTPEVVVPREIYDVALYPGEEHGVALIFITPRITGSFRGRVVEAAAAYLKDQALLDGRINTRQLAGDCTAMAFVSDPTGAKHAANYIFQLLNNDLSQWQPLAIDSSEPVQTI